MAGASSFNLSDYNVRLLRGLVCRIFLDVNIALWKWDFNAVFFKLFMYLIIQLALQYTRAIGVLSGPHSQIEDHRAVREFVEQHVWTGLLEHPVIFVSHLK
jgi:hypothetical protein